MDKQGIFLIIIAVAIAVFDIAIIAIKGKRASISAWAVRLSYKYPSLVFVFAMALGFVMGHIFWRMQTLDIYECESDEVQEIIRTCEGSK